MEKPNLILQLLAGLWNWLDGVRKVVHFMFLVMLPLIIIISMIGNAPRVMVGSSALEIRPVGFLVEQYEGEPFDIAKQEFFGDAPPQTVVQHIVDALEYAKTDDRVEVVHLELSSLFGGGLSKLQRIADSMHDFQESGKVIVASGDFFSQGGYYLAAHADEAYMHPEGAVILQGYGRFRTYFKDAIDTLRVDMNIFKVGTHKSYVEPFSRMTMSDEDRESTENLTGQLWEMYRADVVNARDLEDGAIQVFTEDLIANIEAAGGDIALAAQNHGLIDALLTRGEVRDLLIEYVGENPDEPGEPKSTGMRDYLAQMQLLNGNDVRDENVAVVVASGEITFGSRSPGTIGADSTTEHLRRALNDETVKAVVLRVDSPGGSAFASDVIANEIAALQDAGKPVVASMGSTAASGGYWISAGADKIVASPATITGSIGIFAMFATYQRSMDALGLNVDGAGSSIWAGELRPDREMSEHAKALIQMFIDDGYQDFLSRVATHRNMDLDAVDAIGQGRVWTGVDALGNGLVDELGSLDVAIAAAAELAGLAEDDYGVKTIQTELSPTEQLIIDLLSIAKHAGVEPGDFVSTPSPLQQVASKLETAIAPLLHFDDPKGVYAHCLCDFE